MKKRVLLLSVVLCVLLTGLLWADNSDLYVKTVPISKVYVHDLGYRIVYMKTDLSFAVFYVPNTWFEMPKSGDQPPKAELVMGTDQAYPYFSIFWKSGKFDHIRLYLPKDINDSCYGDLQNPAAYNDKFKVDTLSLQF